MEQLSTANFLNPVIGEDKDLIREFKHRKNEYVTKSVAPQNVDYYEGEGWSFDRKLAHKIRLKKIKPFDERLENKFWCLLYKLGFKDLNQGRNFKITFNRPAGSVGQKQVDIFAKDDGTVVVAECKACEKIRSRSLQKDIEEFANLQRPIANSIRRFYGRGYKPKILWLFVTENILWSEADKTRAEGHHIKRITEREFRYFNQIADHLGHSAKYQFLAEFFAKQKIPELEGRTIPAIRGKLGGRKMYTFVSTPRQLLRISFVNHRSLKDPEGVPTYQRLVQKGRMKNIGKFIDEGGFFPNNILINFNTKVRFDASQKDDEAGVHFGTLYFPNKYKSAWIIDGQHRLYGFSCADDKKLDQNIIVTAFEGMEKAEEANLFVTINHEQKSVQRTLLDDLKGELEWGSEIPTKRIGAISSRLIGLLNDDLGDPFYTRVTAQGIKATKVACLTLPSLMDGLRHSGLIGRAVMKKKVYERGALCDASDEATLQRARAGLNQFFALVREANPQRWDDGPQRCLCSNASVQAYMRLFATLCQHLEMHHNLNPKELEVDQLIHALQGYLDPVLEFIACADEEEFLAHFKVKYGAGGPREYFYRLSRLVRREKKDFEPDGYLDWELSQSEERIALADKQIQEIHDLSVTYIFDRFRECYGTEENAYWEKGVTKNQMKSDAYARSLNYTIEERGLIETYLTFDELKQIIEKKEHWALFKNVFDLSSGAKDLSWMARIGELTRKQALNPKQHPYQAEDFDFVSQISSDLRQRLVHVGAVVS